MGRNPERGKAACDIVRGRVNQRQCRLSCGVECKRPGRCLGEPKPQARSSLGRIDVLVCTTGPKPAAASVARYPDR